MAEDQKAPPVFAQVAVNSVEGITPHEVDWVVAFLEALQRGELVLVRQLVPVPPRIAGVLRAIADLGSAPFLPPLQSPTEMATEMAKAFKDVLRPREDWRSDDDGPDA